MSEPEAVVEAVTHASLAEALAAFQAEMPVIENTQTAHVTGKKRDGTPTSYNYRYAPLGDINKIAMPLLGKHGLSFSSRPTITKTGFELIYKLRHVSGESDGGRWPLPSPDGDIKMQDLGALITYARRYCFIAVTGIAPGGDDDEEAVERADERMEQRQEPRPPDPRHAAEPDDAAERDYEQDIADATSPASLSKIAERIVKDKRMTLEQRNRLHQQFEARMGALTEQAGEQPELAGDRYE